MKLLKIMLVISIFSFQPFFAQENQEPEQSNIQTYTPSKLLEKGKWDIKWFNNLYTQTKGDINGITVDDLFAACIDHLKGWQATELACGYNTKIIALLEQALHECNLRHAERAGRGVTGTSKP